MVITITQLKINGIVEFFRFISRVHKVRGQLKKENGLLSAKFRGFCTLTVWKSYEDMKAFRNSSHHLDAMKNIKSIGYAKSITWEADVEPDWNEAQRKLGNVKFRST